MTSTSTPAQVTPGITYVDGHRIRRAVAAGVRKVIENQEHLNKINVFPVADGDTGTNLALTMSSVLNALRHSNTNNADQILTIVADAALDGARGNSGAILAQFFQGVSDTVTGFSRLTTNQFAQAVKSGEQYARDALTQPREGTVLSVMRDYADQLIQLCKEAITPDFVSLLDNGLGAARISLANTPNQLDALRKAGVVDAGAEGFVDFLDGIGDYISSGVLSNELPSDDQIHIEEFSEQMAGEIQDLDYRFCTECIVSGEQIDRRKLREQLSAIGGSLVLAGTNKKAKIHIHVNDPAKVFDIAATYGKVRGEKADDMHQQQEISHGQDQQVVVTMDSAADMPDSELERLNIHMIPVRLHFGAESYLDKVTINADEFFAKLQTHSEHPKTSQPSPGELRRNYDFLASHYKHVLSVNVTSWGSGTYQAAVSAAERSEHDTISVFDSKSASVGQAMQVIHAAECAQQGMSIHEVLAEIEKARAHTTVYGYFSDLNYSVRGGRVKPVVKRIADFLKLAPVFVVDKNGALKPRRLFKVTDNLAKKFGIFVSRKAQNGATYRVAIAYGTDRDDAEILWQTLQEELKAKGCAIESHYITRLGTALGVHAGPGCLVAGLQRR